MRAFESPYPGDRDACQYPRRSRWCVHLRCPEAGTIRRAVARLLEVARPTTSGGSRHCTAPAKRCERDRRDSISPNTSSSPFMPETRVEWPMKAAPTNMTSSDTASSGPYAPEVRKVSPKRAMPIAMLANGSTRTRAVCDEAMGPA